MLETLQKTTCSLLQQRRYYIYVVFRLDGTPCYVGKGCGNRWQHHANKKRSKNRHFKAIAELSTQPLPCVKVCNDLTEAEAFAYEIIWIKALGRECDGGILTNVLPGGQTSSVKNMGRTPSAATRQKIRQALIGRTLPSEVLEKISAATKGRKHTEARRAITRAAILAAYEKDPTYRERVAEGARGMRSAATREAMVAGQKRRWQGRTPPWALLGIPSTTYYRWKRQGRI